MGTYIKAIEIKKNAYGLTITDDQMGAIDHLIDKAEARLLVKVPGIPARIAAGTLTTELVAGVVEDIVLRVLRNPQAYRQVTVDDASVTLDQSVSGGLLYISADDLEVLGAAGKPLAISSFRMHIPPYRLPQ